MYLELFKSADGWRWRLKAVNHEILATSEAYSSRDACLDTAKLVYYTRPQAIWDDNGHPGKTLICGTHW